MNCIFPRRLAGAPFSHSGAHGIAPFKRKTSVGGMRAAQVLTRLLSAALIATGIGIVVYVNVVDWVSGLAAQQQVTELESRFVQVPEADRVKLLSQAQLYNEQLAARSRPTSAAYDKQLAVEGSDVMAYVEIPSIAVKVPVRHGTSDEVLMQGAGHFEGSSLPVGGSSTRCVVMAHSGMRNSSMFDELYRVVEGDLVIMGCLGEEMLYRVCATEVAAPEKIEGMIAIEPGRDLVTLITCTPYGVNSERVVVTAERVPDLAQDGRRARTTGPRINGRQMAAAAMAAAMGLYAGAYALASRRRRKKQQIWRSISQSMSMEGKVQHE